MKNELQSLEWVGSLVTKRFTKNRNSSISAMFKFLREHKRLSSIGHLSILWVIVSTVIGLGIIPMRSNILYAYNQSSELKLSSKKEKNGDIDHLLNPSSVESKQYKNSLS